MISSTPDPLTLLPARPLRLLGEGLAPPNHLRRRGARRLGRLLALVARADPGRPWAMPELQCDIVHSVWRTDGHESYPWRDRLSPPQRETLEALALHLLSRPLTPGEAWPVPEVWERQAKAALHPGDTPPRGWSSWEALLIPGESAPRGMQGPEEEEPLRLQSRSLDEALRLLNLPAPWRVGRAATLREEVWRGLRHGLQAGAGETVPGPQALEDFLARAWAEFPRGARIGSEEYHQLIGLTLDPEEERRRDLRQGLVAPPRPWTTPDPRAARPWPSVDAHSLHEQLRAGGILADQHANDDLTEHPLDVPLRLAFTLGPAGDQKLRDTVESLIFVSEIDAVMNAAPQADYDEFRVERSGQGAPVPGSGPYNLRALRGQALHWPLTLQALRPPEPRTPEAAAWSSQPLRGSLAHLTEISTQLSDRLPWGQVHTSPNPRTRPATEHQLLWWALCERFGAPDPAPLTPWRSGPMPGEGHDLRRLPGAVHTGQVLSRHVETESGEVSLHWTANDQALPAHLSLTGLSSQDYASHKDDLERTSLHSPGWGRSWLRRELQHARDLTETPGLTGGLLTLLDTLPSGGLLVDTGRATWVISWVTTPGVLNGRSTPVQRVTCCRSVQPHPASPDTDPFTSLVVMTRPIKEPHGP